MKIIFDKRKQKKAIKTWCPQLEQGTLEQAINLSNLPFIYKHVALMPDAHQGYGMPIGAVIACIDKIIPNAVGVDIGCGVATVKTNITNIDKKELKEILKSIREKIPTGFNHHKKPKDDILMPQDKTFAKKNLPIVYQEYDSALKQIGTLGGGNHFIEIQQDANSFVWFMIHSGSRNLGYKVANYYNNMAKSNCSTKNNLAFLDVKSKLGQSYLKEMNFCLAFAKANRDLMIEQIKRSFPLNVKFEKTINIHHNYAALEKHFTKNVWIHRKGATSAKKGQLGIIPGSQGTPSYIIEGKGNAESFMSCSHGAGRKMSRTQAQRKLNLQEEQKKLNEKNILHSIRGKKDLDEAAGAYKDIELVMQDQKDLVDIISRLNPLAVIKG